MTSESPDHRARSAARLLIALCYIASAAALIGAILYLGFGANRMTGVVAALLAGLTCRILLVNVRQALARRLEP
jgi:hypothetical protein